MSLLQQLQKRKTNTNKQKHKHKTAPKTSKNTNTSTDKQKHSSKNKRKQKHRQTQMPRRYNSSKLKDTKTKIKTQWANCVMLETDFDDITSVIRKWIEIDLKLSPHSNATEYNHENDSQTDNVEQQQNVTEIPKTWEGIDVYVTSKVVFSFDFNHNNSVIIQIHLF